MSNKTRIMALILAAVLLLSTLGSIAISIIYS